MPRKKRGYETYNWWSNEAKLCYWYAFFAAVAVIHNLRDTYPTMHTLTTWIVLWSVVGLGFFCVGLQLRRRIPGKMLVVFSIVLLLFALLLSFYHPQLIQVDI